MNENQAKWRVNKEGEPVRRHELKQLLPMDTPLTIDLEVSSVCCLKCNYCPQSLDEETKKNMNIGQAAPMNMDLFERFVVQCKSFPHAIKTLRFCGYGEPLLNRDIHKMVSLAKRTGIAERISVFSNGLALSNETATALVDAGVDTFLFDIQGISEEDYLDVSNTKIDFKRLHDNILFLYNLNNRGKIFVKTFKFIVEGRRDRFFDVWGDCCDEIVIENIYETNPGIDYSGMITTEKEDGGTGIYSSKYCPWPWYQVAISSSGRVTSCPIPPSKNDDFLFLGDINTESIVDIWRGIRLKEVRRMLLEEERSCKSCAECKYTELLPQEDLIDEIVPKLRSFLEEE